MRLLSVFSSSLFITGLLGVSNITLADVTNKVYKVSNVKSSGALHLRSAPGTKANILLELPHDARWIVPRNVSKKYGHSSWQKVNWNDQEGWVNNAYIAFDPEATAIAEQRRQCILSGKTNHVCCGYPKQKLSGKEYPIKVFNVVRVESGESLNMRVNPGIKNKSIATIPHNAVGVVKLPGNKVKKGNQIWEKVRWNGRNGWVNSYYLSYNSGLSAEKNNIRKICSK